MSTTLRIPAGSEIRFGAPARPFSAELREKIAIGLSSISGILEVHLPMCHIPTTMPEPAHVLVVVFDRGTELNSVMPAVSKVVHACVPTGTHLDVLPLDHSNPLIDVVRKAKCSLFVKTPTAKPWWSLRK